MEQASVPYNQSSLAVKKIRTEPWQTLRGPFLGRCAAPWVWLHHVPTGANE
jgi:hypothetical protein